MPELMLLSNSRMPGGEPFAWAQDFFASSWVAQVKTIALVPFAGMTLSWDDYLEYVAGAFPNHLVESVHATSDPIDLVMSADAIFVGGGNTFNLCSNLHASGLVPVIREAVRSGKPYLGWSAGANAACPTLCTTNDMPIVQPPTFEMLNLVPFQINPHYTNERVPNHGGESRNDRIAEFLIANPTRTVVGLPEGNLIQVSGSGANLLGTRDAIVFESGKDPSPVSPNSDVSYLISG